MGRVDQLPRRDFILGEVFVGRNFKRKVYTFIRPNQVDAVAKTVYG